MGVIGGEFVGLILLEASATGASGINAWRGICGGDAMTLGRNSRGP